MSVWANIKYYVCKTTSINYFKDYKLQKNSFLFNRNIIEDKKVHVKCMRIMNILLYIVYLE